MTPFLDISGRRIGPGYPAYVVADLVVCPLMGIGNNSTAFPFFEPCP